ncbi:PhnB protein [Gracilibacillus orientalis]|uniref:PhnB protein n=1 Tax=Gracilibacillus orientalis TaxID=334253 RepID=A0A1I4H033_9BACI|nr:VOC family protein [Gracilibacillus orientalis]SFL35692.1 PhnB protein [Gracilibacillus orientalis]
MPVNPYLMLNGNAREVIEFYEKAFQTEPAEIMTYGDIPGPENETPEEMKSLVVHGRIFIDGTPIMFSDVTPDMEYKEGNNVNLTVVSDNVELLKNAYKILQEDGKLEMEMQKTFWSENYAKLTDKFGIHWQLSSE